MAVDEVEELGDLFQEPNDYYMPEKPVTYAAHTLLSGETMRLRLVGHNPLWGHLLWNAGQVISEYLQHHADLLVVGKNILELGAGAGLPGIVCASLGAKKVVVTDYPDQDLIDNIQYNIDHYELAHSHGTDISVEGYLWGAPIPSTFPTGFELLILADLLFNHSEHGKLLSTVSLTLRRNTSSRALVFFTPYRPWLLEKDLAFFELARQSSFVVEQVTEKVMDKVMFEKDRGDELLRRTVFGYQLRWPDGGDNQEEREL
ncbi:nicotinamide n-methyltransferase [Varicellaria rhodocarpa]|nr:nicotinamide n-methyltransferase [Varicellaria rhodocarpa]